MRSKTIVKTALSFLAVCLILLFGRAIFAGLPGNIFCFQDVGTHRVPSEFIEVNDKQSVGQSFMSNFAGLFKVAVFVSKNEADPDSAVCFHLRKKGGNEDIFFQEWKLSEINPPKNDFYIIPEDPFTANGFHYHIQFPVINESKDQEFYFYLESPGVKSGRGIKVGIWKTKYYEALRSGSMYINQRPSDYFVAFRTFNTWLGTSESLINDVKERLLKDKPFVVFYASIVTLTIIGILLTVRAK